MADALRRFHRVHFAASPRQKSIQAQRALRAMYGDAGPDDADVVVALGGAGFMLETLHAFIGRDVPIYGMNCGSVGFLMNEYAEEGLLDRLDRAENAVIRPLKAKGRDIRQRPFSAL